LEACLREILENEIKVRTDEFRKMFRNDTFGPEFLGQMNLKGERVRGLQILVGYYMGGNYGLEQVDVDCVKERVKVALPLAVGLEFIQTAMLIQDDVIDGALCRRNQVTIHREFVENEVSPCRNAVTEANGAAHFLATSCFMYGMNLIQKDDIYGCDIREKVYQMLYETISGEALDVLLPLDDRIQKFGNENKHELALVIAEKKTAVYSFEFPLCAGFLLRNMKKEAEVMWEIGQQLGIVYQLNNDLRELNLMSDRNSIPYDLVRYRITYANAVAMENEKLRDKIWKFDKNAEEKEEIIKEYPVNFIKGVVQEKKKKYIEVARQLFSEEIEWDAITKKIFWGWLMKLLGEADENQMIDYKSVV
jgi:geranylgeranyl pyrophosphate synthase